MDLFTSTYAELDREQAEQLSRAPAAGYTFEVVPSWDGSDIPATLNRFIRTVREPQSKWLGLKNVSPVTVFELRRNSPDRLRFQFSMPTKRLEREIRTHLPEEAPGTQFDNGVSGLPVEPGKTVGGGFLTLGRDGWLPLETDPDRPLMNSVVSALHQESMKDSRFVLQILFKPVAGRSIKNWWWRKSAYRELRFLRGEKVSVLSGSERSATPREKTKADLIQEKADSPRFLASIRILVIGAGEYTRSRVRELAAAFNPVESDESGQYLKTVTVKSIRQSRLVNFAESVNQRRFDGYALPFQVSPGELAALVSLPSIEQENIRRS